MNGYSQFAAGLSNSQLASELAVFQRDPHSVGSVACDGFWKYRALLEEKRNREKPKAKRNK